MNSIRDCVINIKSKKFIVKVVYPNWNINFITPSDKGEAIIKLSKYIFDGISSDIDIGVKLGRALFSFVKLSKDSNGNVRDSQWNILVIRWTKFVVGSKDDGKTFVLLDIWKIDLFTKLWKQFVIDNLKPIIGFYKNKLIDVLKKDPKEVWKLVSRIVVWNYQLKNDYKIKLDTKDFEKIKQKYQTKPRVLYKLFSWEMSDLVYYAKVDLENTPSMDIFLFEGQLLRPDQIIPRYWLINIYDVFNHFCEIWNGKKLLKYDKFSIFVKQIGYNPKYKKFTFKLNSQLEDKLKKWYLLVLWTNFSWSVMNVLYYDPYEEVINYWPLWNQIINWEMYKYKWIALICNY